MNLLSALYRPEAHKNPKRYPASELKKEYKIKGAVYKTCR